MKNIQIRRLATRSTPFIPGIMAILTAIAIIISPESSFEASLQGLKLWWTLVFPALLPFLMLSEMLTASGFVHGFGVLLEPLMKRSFVSYWCQRLDLGTRNHSRIPRWSWRGHAATQAEQHL